MMVFKEIDLFHIRSFDQKRLIFNSGFNLIPLGHSEGKSTIIESLRSVMSISVTEPAGFFKEGAPHSSIIVKLEIDQIKFILTKQWSDHRLCAHTVNSEESGLSLDLNDSRQALKWVSLFLRHNDKMFDENNSNCQPNLLLKRYDFFSSLVLTGFNISNEADEGWYHTLFNSHFHDYIGQEVPKLQTAAAAQLNELKVTRQIAASRQKIIERYDAELSHIDKEIKRTESIISQLVSNAEADEAELHQAETINDFILTKKNEIEKINFELRSYNSLLNNNIVTEFSEDEIKEIDKKRKTYEQISNREEMLRGKLIERDHLEKNLNGILNEISLCRVVQITTAELMDKSPLDVYDAEVKKIRETLKNYSTLEHDLEVTKKEKYLYQSSHDKYLVMSKIKQFTSQNEQKKIRTLIETLGQERDVIAKELEQMQASIHDERYRSLQTKVRQVRQQVLEQSKRLEVLYENRMHTLRMFKETAFAGPDLTFLESRIRKQMHLNKYLSVIGEVSQFIQNEMLTKRRDGFLNFVQNLSGILPDFFVPIAEQFVQEHEKFIQKKGMDRYSHSQIAEFNLIFRMVCVNYATNCRTVFLDEHYRWLLDPIQTRRIENMLTPLNFTQVIAFDKS